MNLLSFIVLFIDMFEVIIGPNFYLNLTPSDQFITMFIQAYYSPYSIIVILSGLLFFVSRFCNFGNNFLSFHYSI